MKKLIFLLLITLFISACSNTPFKQGPSIISPEFDINGIKIPLQIEDIKISSVDFYPLKDVENYYGVQLKVRNTSYYTMSRLIIEFKGDFNNKSYYTSRNLYEEDICQSQCSYPLLTYGGTMYFEGSIESLSETMKMVEVSYQISGDNNGKGTFYSYFIESNTYEVSGADFQPEKWLEQ